MEWYFGLYYLILTTGCIIGFVYYRTFPASLRFLFWSIVLSTLTEYICLYLVQIKRSGTLLIYHIYIPIAYVLYCLIYFAELRNKLILYSIIGFLAFYLLNIILWQPFFTKFASYSVILMLVLTTIWVLWYFRRLLANPEEKNLKNYSLFPASCGLLLFNASTLIVFSAHDILSEQEYIAAFPVFNIIRQVANDILYSTFILSFIGKKVTLRPQT